jgi:hypothetical protein
LVAKLAWIAQATVARAEYGPPVFSQLYFDHSQQRGFASPGPNPARLALMRSRRNVGAEHRAGPGVGSDASGEQADLTVRFVVVVGPRSDDCRSETSAMGVRTYPPCGSIGRTSSTMAPPSLVVII